MRTGDFYETYGVDALMMVAYAGTNRFNKSAFRQSINSSCFFISNPTNYILPFAFQNISFVIYELNHPIGLNPMGNKCKAGCPVKNVQSTLDGLTSAGLSVAVYEEVSEIDISKSTKVSSSSAYTTSL